MRIAHFSDLHLRHALRGSSENPERLCRQMPQALAAAVVLVNDLSPDLLAITGDLVDYPSDLMDDPATRQRGLRDYGLIAELLDEVDCPVVAIPGNHDHSGLMRQAFGPLTVDQTLGKARVVAFPEDAEDEGKRPHRAGEAWERLEAVCDDAHSPLKVFLQHYIVWPDANEGYPHTYVEAEPMRAMLSGASGTVLSLSGHLHVGASLQQHQGAWYAAVPALCVAPHPVWLYELGEGGDGDITCQEHLVAWKPSLRSEA